MKGIIALVTLVAGVLLALSPMIFTTAEVHADRVFYAQCAGFALLACGVVMGFASILKR